jgi:hypothetical protein
MMFQASTEARRLLFVRGILTKELYFDTQWYWHDLETKANGACRAAVNFNLFPLPSLPVPNYTIIIIAPFDRMDNVIILTIHGSRTEWFGS